MANIVKREYDEQERVTYLEYDDGTWEKSKCDSYGNEIFREWSENDGVIHWQQWVYTDSDDPNVDDPNYLEAWNEFDYRIVVSTCMRPYYKEGVAFIPDSLYDYGSETYYYYKTYEVVEEFSEKDLDPSEAYEAAKEELKKRKCKCEKIPDSDNDYLVTEFRLERRERVCYHDNDTGRIVSNWDEVTYAELGRDDSSQIHDTNGNKLFHEDSDGYGYWSKWKYDTNGNVIYEETDDGYWEKREYDTSGHNTYYENSKGYLEKYEYDSNGNKLFQKDSDGYWEKYKYDSNGNQTYYEDSNGDWLKCEYDENGREIYREYADGYWKKREYDANGNEIYYEDKKGFVIDRREQTKSALAESPKQNKDFVR